MHLEPGEETKVTFTLDKRSFAYYDVALKDWHVEAGEFKVLIGKSSREIVMEESLFVTSTTPVKKIRVDRNTLVGDLLADPLLSSRASQMLGKINETHPFAQMAGDGNMSDMLAAMMKYMPLRALANFSGGTFTEEMLEDMIAKLNEVSA
ncbi:Thermostable beta-glucosidase B [compost metagenome]